MSGIEVLSNEHALYITSLYLGWSEISVVFNIQPVLLQLQVRIIMFFSNPYVFATRAENFRMVDIKINA